MVAIAISAIRSVKEKEIHEEGLLIKKQYNRKHLKWEKTGQASKNKFQDISINLANKDIIFFLKHRYSIDFKKANQRINN